MQAFHLFATQAAEMEMVMAVAVTLTAPAQGEIVFAVIGQHFVGYTVLAETIKHPINGYTVHFPFYFLLYHILAQCRSCLVKQSEYGVFCRGVSSFHY